MRTRGVTLVELVVVLAIVGITTVVAGLAFRAPDVPSAADDVRSRVADARRRALATGRPVPVELSLSGRRTMATAHPDGSIVGEPEIRVDRLVGRELPGYASEDGDAASR